MPGITPGVAVNSIVYVHVCSNNNNNGIVYACSNNISSVYVCSIVYVGSNVYSKTSEERTSWDRGLCPLFGGCPFFTSKPYSVFLVGLYATGCMSYYAR